MIAIITQNLNGGDFNIPYLHIERCKYQSEVTKTLIDWSDHMIFLKGNSGTLTEIGYLEALPDGSIWKDQTMLEEYLKWRENKNYGVKDGVFFGSYGIASSFEDYVRLYNISYYVTTGLRREEQFYGAHGFLYASREQAHLSIDKLNGYQKVKEK